MVGFPSAARIQILLTFPVPWPGHAPGYQKESATMQTGPKAAHTEHGGGGSGLSSGLALFPLILALISLLVRSWNLNWGLPELEEEALPLKKAFAMCGWGTGQLRLDPETSGWPSLSFYIHMLVQYLEYGVGRLAGFFDNRGDFFLQQITWTPVAVWARGVGVAAATVMTWVGARLGGRLAGTGGALVAGGLLAFSPMLTRQAQLISPDIILAACAALALWFTVRAQDHGRTRDHVLAGLCIGLGISAKYTPVLLLPVLVLAHVLHVRSQGRVGIGALLRDRRPWLGVVACVVAFAVTSPYVLLEMQVLQRDVGYQMSHMSEGHLGHGTQAAGPVYYARDVLAPGLGWPGFLLGCAGLALAAWRRRGPWLVVAATLVIYFVAMSMLQTRFERYLLPGLLPLALGCAGLWQTVRNGRVSSRPVLVGFVLLLVVVAPAAWSSVEILLKKGRPGTLQLAREWLLERRGEGELYVAMEQYTPALPRLQDLEGRRQDPAFAHLDPQQRRRWLDMRPVRVVHLPMYSTGSNAADFFYDIRHFLDYDFVVTSSAVRGRYEDAPAEFPAQVTFYDRLDSSLQNVATFAGEGVRRGPEIRIYQVDDAARRSLARQLPGVAQSEFRAAAGKVVASHFRGFLNTVARHAAERGDYRRAADYYQPLYDSAPPQEKEQLLRPFARALTLAGNHDLARPLCQRWRRLEPDNPTPRGFLGAGYLAAGDAESARRELQACLDLAVSVPGQEQLAAWARDQLATLATPGPGEQE